MASEVDTEFPYRVRIVDRGVDCRDPCLPTPFPIPRVKQTSKKLASEPPKLLRTLKTLTC